ncbi:hypothetical protein P5V15_006426 [Pogonomyrmex californicus]
MYVRAACGHFLREAPPPPSPPLLLLLPLLLPLPLPPLPPPPPPPSSSLPLPPLSPEALLIRTPGAYSYHQFLPSLRDRIS